MIARVRLASSSGSKPPRFCRRTALSFAARSASSSDAAVGMDSAGDGIGWSNNPRRNFSRSMLRTAASISPMVTSPRSTSDFK